MTPAEGILPGSSAGAGGRGIAVSVEVDAESSVAELSADERMSLWMSDDELKEEKKTWSSARQCVDAIIRSEWFNMIMGTVIVFNIGLLVQETDQRAKNYPAKVEQHEVHIWLDRGILAIYTVEALARIFVHRKRYFCNRFNMLDFVIVVAGISDFTIELVMGEVKSARIMEVLPMLRILRVLRLIRTLRLLRFHPELYLFITSFVGAMRAMFWGFVLILLMILLWAFVFLEVIHPLSVEMIAKAREADPNVEIEPFCEAAFSSVFHTLIFLFRTLVAQDEWGACIVPIINYSAYTFILFALAFMSISLGFMHLIMAAIVDNACEARERDKAKRAEELSKVKKMEKEEALQRWNDVVRNIDADSSGTISHMELKKAYKNMPELRHTLNVLGIWQEDLEIMFKLMDEDGSGDLDYVEFVHTLVKAQQQDLRIYLMMMKLQTDAVARTYKTRGKASHGVVEVQRQDGVEEAVEVNEQPVKVNKQVVSNQVVEAPNCEAAATAAVLDADLQALNARIQWQFEALARSIDLEFSNVAEGREPEALESASIWPRHTRPKKQPLQPRGLWHREFPERSGAQEAAQPSSRPRSRGHSPQSERNQWSKKNGQDPRNYGLDDEHMSQMACESI